nr:hypothetical protein [Pseudomonas sp. Marseille-Q3773]
MNRIIFSHLASIETVRTILSHTTFNEAISTSLCHPTINEAIGTSLCHPTIIEPVGTILSHQWRHGVLARLLPNADLLGGQRHRTCAQYRQGDSNHHVVDLVHDSVSVIGDGFVAGCQCKA